MQGGMCKCPHHKVIPVLIVLFGLTFLLGALGVISGNTVSIIWPSLIILGGLMKLTKGMCKCCSVEAPKPTM
jgi:hypothetical protein